jgi:hypothetical protein
MKLSPEELRQRFRTRAKPYVGHEGIGSRINLEQNSRGLIIKESFFSQLFKSFGLLLFGPGLTILSFVEREKFARHPWPILVVLAFFSLFGWYFGLKFLSQLLGGRRVEIRAADGAILLIPSGNRIETLIERSDQANIEIISTWYRSKGKPTENFTLRVTTSDGKHLDLCTSDKRAEIEKILAKLPLVT